MQVRHAVSIGLAGLGVLAVVATAPALMGAQAGPADLALLKKEQAQASAEALAKAEQEKQAQAEKKAQAEAKDKARIVIRERSGPVAVGEGPGPVWVGAAGPRLGIQIREVGKDDLAKYKLANQAGVVVEEVSKDSAAEKAGVKSGDVLVAFDGETLRSVAHLRRLVAETAPGRSAKMGVMRDGKRVDLEITPEAGGDAMSFVIDRDRIRADVEKQLQEKRGDLEKELEVLREKRGDFETQRRRLDEMAPGGALRWRMERPEGRVFEFFGPGEGPMAFAYGMARGRLGVTVQDLTPELAAYFGVKDGVLVSSVQADTPAAKAGIKAGDVITTVDDKAVTSPGELVSTLRGKTGEVTIGVTRDKKAISLKATLEKPAVGVTVGRTRA